MTDSTEFDDAWHESHPAGIAGGFDEALSRVFRLGMPHLGPAGLFENWVLKEAGNAHWMALAGKLSTRASALTDRSGNRLYASFVQLELSGSPLSRFREDMLVAVSTQLYKISEQRYYSRFKIRALETDAFLTVQLLSVFIRRRSPDDNKSIAAEDLAPNRNARFDEPDAQALAWAASVRHPMQGPTTLEAAQAEPAYRSTRYSPCPAIDFNNAGLLYFANFQQILDRCEWEILPDIAHAHIVTANRRIRYYGNVDQTDSLIIFLLPKSKDGGGVVTDSLVFRQSDGRLLAHSIVDKVFS